MGTTGPMYSKLDGSQDVKALAQQVDSRQDGKRRVYEICMVFRHKTSKLVKFEDGDMDASRGLREPTGEARGRMQVWKQRREGILKSLQNCGLHIMCYYSRDRDEVIVKVGASAQKLRDTAARMKYKLQMKKQFLGAYAEYRHDFPGRPERQYKDRRIVSHIYQTHTEEDLPDSDGIFKTLDKIHLVHHIITSKDKDCAGINIGTLLHQGELRAYFPLHETNAVADLRMNKVQWFLMPEDFANKIRDYLGERLALYFLFMAFYWKWLAPMAAVGLLLQLIDLLAGSPDNVTAIPFCVLMSVWCTFLPYFWRRQEAKYAIGWGTLDMVEVLEPCRPEHHGEPRINPVTAQVEPYYPWQKRLAHYAVSGAVIVTAGGLLVFTVLLLCLFRHHMEATTTGGIVLFQFLLALYVEVMNGLLTRLARWLTVRENHRTQSEYETHLLSKVSVFKFVSSYSVLYYIAFFKKHSYLFNVKMECMKGDCFIDLQSQLAVFVFFRLTFCNAFEYTVPRIKSWWRSCADGQSALVALSAALHGQSRLELAEMSAAEQEAKKDKFDEFSNFDEILISHGFATLFAATSPWVCAATLVGTLVEVYGDMRSLTEQRQRPMPTRARTNEPWSTAFEVYGVLAATTNLLLLIFASDQYDSWTLTEKLVLFIYLEHLIILARLVVQLIFTQVPRNVELLQLKQENMVHRCLENIKVEEQQDFSIFRDTTGGRIEVFESDFPDREEDDEEEPTLNMRESGKTLLQGMREEGSRWLSGAKR